MLRWFRILFQKQRTEDQLDKELRFHIEQKTRDYISAGMNPDEALRKARLEFGGLDQIK
jgi:putative ABC transport system permease protein